MAFGIDDVIGEGLKLINKFIPDPAQRAAAELEVFKMKQAGDFKEIEERISASQELTKRQENDMKSDSWLSKNIRPLVMIYFLTLISLIAFKVVSGVAPEFLAMVKEFTLVGLQFYFGGRTLEKVISMGAAAYSSKKEN